MNTFGFGVKGLLESFKKLLIFIKICGNITMDYTCEQFRYYKFLEVNRHHTSDLVQDFITL